MLVWLFFSLIPWGYEKYIPMGLPSSCATRKSHSQSLWLWVIKFPFGDQMALVDFWQEFRLVEGAIFILFNCVQVSSSFGYL